MASIFGPDHSIRVIEHVTVPLSDGTRLAARLWLPAESTSRESPGGGNGGHDGDTRVPVPAVLEYIPYRKRDLTRTRDEQMHSFFASSGYASIRVDLRGSGDSEGVLTDEYLPQELDDGEEVIEWIARQSWCNGSVGMIGISWGGFNGLQIAARRPEALKAVISVSSTDDRYADDVHYMGGCLLGDNISWASTMFAYNSMPPDPVLVGDAWRDMWHERLSGSGLWLKTWLEHQKRNDYWKHGSVCEDYSAIQCPVMAVSGWADGYSNAVFRLLAGLSVPRWGIIGPWSHTYPHLGTPGPAIGFLQECLRFWGRWLRGEDTGIDSEPMLRAWMLSNVDPATDYRVRPGRWVGESTWPAPGQKAVRYALGLRRLFPLETGSSAADSVVDTGPEAEPGPAAEPEPDPGLVLGIQSPLSVGLFAGKWCSYSSAPDLPYDQREEDGGSLVFETDAFDEPFEILGAPEVELEVRSDRPVALLAVRISDVAPDGKATRVTYGLLNLTHRDSHEEPRPLEPGKWETIRVPMNYVAQRFAVGRRLRLSISTSYWPLAWPPPEPVRIDVRPAACRLTIPVRALSGEDSGERPVAFEAPLHASGPEKSVIRAPQHNWVITRDLALDRSELHVVSDHGTYRIEDIDLEVRRTADEWYRYTSDDVSSVESEVTASRSLRRGRWKVRTETRTLLRCTSEQFELHATLDAYEGDIRVFSRTWNESIPRNLL